MTNYNKIEIVQGDTYHATINITNGSGLAFTSVKFVCTDFEQPVEITISGNVLDIPSSTTASWTPGRYTYSIIGYMSGGRKTLIYKNTLTVLPNPET